MHFQDVVRRVEDGARRDKRFRGDDQPGRVSVRDLLQGCCVPSCSPLFRRAVIDPLPTWYFELPWGDWPLYFLAGRRRARFTTRPKLWGCIGFTARACMRGFQRSTPSR